MTTQTNTEYKYHLTIRPFDIATYPENNFVRHEYDGTKYGIVVYDKSIGLREMKHFDLNPITEVENYIGKVMFQELGENTIYIHIGLNEQYEKKDNNISLSFTEETNGEEYDKELVTNVEFLKRLQEGQYLPIN